MKYSVLLFDLDHTLLDFEFDMKSAFLSLCQKQNINADDALYNSYSQINHAWWLKFEKGLCTKDELFIGRFSDLISKHKINADPKVLSKAIFPELSCQAKLFNGAYELIERLSKSHSIYFATNGNAESQKKRLKLCGLDKFSSGIFVSEDAGAAKPDKRYFDFVFSKINKNKNESIIIGDSLSSDIEGANNFGIDSIWFNPQKLENHSPIQPTFTANTYSEVELICNK